MYCLRCDYNQRISALSMMARLSRYVHVRGRPIYQHLDALLLGQCSLEWSPQIGRETGVQ